MGKGTVVLPVLAALILGAAVCSAQPRDKTTRETKAKQVAAAWFGSLMKGDTAVTTALSAVPFSFDRKQTIRSIGELEKMLESIAQKNGKRDIKPTAIKIGDGKSDPLSGDLIAVVLMIEDEGVTVSVKPGDTYKVVGFSD